MTLFILNIYNLNSQDKQMTTKSAKLVNEFRLFKTTKNEAQKLIKNQIKSKREIENVK